MPDDNILSRFGKSLSDYHGQEGAWIPGIAAGALSAGLGALNTRKRKDETPQQRALRTVRNALVAGSLGAAGGQLAAYGASSAMGAVNGTGEGGPGRKSVFSSPLARMLYTAPHYGLKKWRQGLNKVKAYEQLFPQGPGEHLKSLRYNPSAKKGPHNPRMNLDVPLPFAPKGKKPSGRQLGKFWDSKLKLLAAPTVDIGGHRGVKTLNKVVENLTADPKTSFAGRFGVESEATAKKQLKSWLANQGVGGKLPWWKRTVRALSPNTQQHALNRSSVIKGRIGTATLLAPLFAPEIVNAASNLIGDPSGEGNSAFLPDLPNFGAYEEEKKPSWLLRGMGY